MKTKIFKAGSRGLTNIDWLKSYHTFSFSNYHNPQRINFGTLRVINDDEVAAGRGFDTHSHADMEIISIPLAGSLKHQDTLGTNSVIHLNDIQIMSAGTGLKHSEYNNSTSETVKFIQIWLFSKEKGIQPAYDQKMFDPSQRKNIWQLVVSPQKNQGVQIHQNAYFSLTSLEKGNVIFYEVNQKGNGIFLMVLEGSVIIEDQELSRRDSIGIEEVESIKIKANTNSELLLMEVPMDIPSFYFKN
jgi:redox-sensitive bicupin YhaK (pirin superfamily)